MDRRTEKQIWQLSFFLAVGLGCAVIVSGEWLIAIAALAGWYVGMSLTYGT